MTPVILVIDSEPQVRKFLRASLRAEGFRTMEAKNADEGLSLAIQHPPDLVILDRALPDLDGVEVVRRLRGWTQAPIIVLSARSHEAHKVEALDSGADDYVTKPFASGELHARIRAALRRSAMCRAADPGGVFKSGPLRVELESRRVFAGEGEVHLTPIEYKILTTLVHHAGRVVTHRHLLEVVWGPKKAEAVDSLRVHITHLRRKLEHDPLQPAVILTEAGVGYRLQISERH